MSSNRSPQTFLKRQREQRKQLEQSEKVARRRERSARKKARKNGEEGAVDGPPSEAGDPETTSPGA